ncbi:MAG: DUF91 domain-containing protein [Pseudomonadota bacterium]|nr:DUF91 domain-containing protein [Pseudomonadota bacterium]
MQQERYKAWLELQRYQSNTITAQMHRAGRVEEYYGDLDEHFEMDQLESVIEDLKYSTADRQANRPNCSKIPFNGDPYSNLASYRDAVNRYKKFRTDETILVESASDDDAPLTVPPSAAVASSKQSISLERDLQATLRESIDQLEPGLEIVDEGAERSVDSGFIDITAKDRYGVTVVIELKTGTESPRVSWRPFGLSYAA